MEWQRMLMDPTLSPTQLRDMFRNRLEASDRFTSVGDVPHSAFALDARTRGGTTVRLDLEGLFTDLVRLPREARVQRFEDQIAASLETARAADGELPPLTRDQLVPTIKNLAWLEAASGSGLAAAGFVADLVVVYAWDRQSTLAYARLEELDQLGLSMADAQPLSLQNLRARLPRELATRGDGKSFLLVAGGNFEASLILLPEIWDGLSKQLSGDLVCCVLARDVLIVTSTGTAGGIQSLLSARDRIRESMPSGDLISTTLLVRQRGIWSVFDLAMH
jgi:uncharacterized protein YtpQ (UPF0354 family)